MANLRVRAEAYAFRQLVEHLQANTDVQNIDMMNLSGFCRNCLSKWLCAGAREHGADMSYDEACEDVYGMPYPEWKKKHQTPATAEQLELFKKTHDRHSKHEQPQQRQQQPASPPPKTANAPVSSNVCCQEAPESQAPPETAYGGAAVPLTLSVLTVSDRASRGEYQDESGPAIQDAVRVFAQKTGVFAVTVEHTAIVADDQPAIEARLKEWADTGRSNLIVTTGGTGLSQRDVTPEATARVLHRAVPGIPETLRAESAKFVPLAVLSRAVAGVRHRCLIVNLPGRPKAVRECLNTLLPLLPHALAELSKPTVSLVADDQPAIEARLKEWADSGRSNLIVTTGGTGLSQRDVTPEATARVLHRAVPGIPETLRAESATFVPLAVLSRAVAGVRHRCLIVNQPGRPKAVRECLNTLLPARLGRALKTDVGRLPRTFYQYRVSVL
ncbi:Molybdopterin adenylyltransferase [Diplonema papillatum]|nr:Molybdopterin adenylyltransferase [Diplonema papillatum]